MGLFQLITLSIKPRTLINAVYSIIFGLMILIAEARWSGLLKHFKFLTHFLGLGMFYIFVGGIALGGAWYQYAEAILCLAVGAVYLILGFACRTMAEPDFNKPTTLGKGAYGNGSAAPAAQSNASSSRADVDPFHDIKKQAAHMAVDHALENPDTSNPFA